MFNLLQSIIRNANRTVFNEGIFQRSLRALYSCLFIIGIFARVGVYSIKASGFYIRGPWNSSVNPIFVPIFLRWSYLNE